MSRPDADVPPRDRLGLEALSLLSKKWHPVVLVALAHYGPQGFNELREVIPGVSGKVLTETLESLREAGLVDRREVSESPLRVEYDLTDAGCDMEPVFEALAEWGERHLDSAVPRVLVADADRRLTGLYGRWLDGRYAVARAHGGDELDARLDDRVDVVLLDDRLPGTDTRAFVPGLDSDCRTVILVGDRPAFDLLTVPCDDILRKPIIRETIVAAVDRQLSRRGESPARRERGSHEARLSLFESVYPAERLEATGPYQDARDRLAELAVRNGE